MQSLAAYTIAPPICCYCYGLSVRIVDDDSIDPRYARFYQSLLSRGIAIITDTKSSLMHNKFAAFNNQVTWTGSANFTNTAFTQNGENVVLITDTAVTDIYHTEFNEMFGGRFSNDKSDNTSHLATVGSTLIEVTLAHRWHSGRNASTSPPARRSRSWPTRQSGRSRPTT